MIQTQTAINAAFGEFLRKLRKICDSGKDLYYMGYDSVSQFLAVFKLHSTHITEHFLCPRNGIRGPLVFVSSEKHSDT